MRNIFRSKNSNKVIKNGILKDIKNLFELEEEEN